MKHKKGRQIVVMKFGGASLATAAHFNGVGGWIDRCLAGNQSVVVVVSAMAKTTNRLLKLARMVHSDPPKRELDMLVSVGERVSMSLLAMALDKRGIEAMSFTGSQSGIITTNTHGNAQIVEVRPHRIEKALEEGKVAIVAGFQGMSLDREVTTLGRGGSDVSAVAIGVALQATVVEFYKDVEGVASEDPHLDPDAKVFSHLTYEEAIAIVQRGAKILHPASLELAQEARLPLHIRPFADPEKRGTWISHSL